MSDAQSRKHAFVRMMACGLHMVMMQKRLTECWLPNILVLKQK